MQKQFGFVFIYFFYPALWRILPQNMSQVTCELKDQRKDQQWCHLGVFCTLLVKGEESDETILNFWGKFHAHLISVT